MKQAGAFQEGIGVRSTEGKHLKLNTSLKADT